MRISDWSSDVCSSDLFLRGCPRGFQPVAVAFGIAELQRVFADGQRRQALMSAIEQLVEARVGADPFMEITLRADRQIFLEFLGEQYLPAAPAFVPERPEERRVGQECVSTCRSRW